MGVKTKIEAAMETQLKTLTGLPPTQFPNVEFVPPTDASIWCRASLLPAQPDIASLGEDGWNYYAGIFQVSVFAKKGNGSGDATTLAEQIAAKFKRGTTLSASGFGIRCRMSWLPPPIEEDSYWHQPVRCVWEVFTAE